MSSVYWVQDELENYTSQIKNMKVLVAGVGGNGSYAAETLIRLGFRNIFLVDLDRVENRNLARQNYIHGDINVSKVSALSKRLQAIAPDAEIETNNEGITFQNCKDLVSSVDITIDTMDDYRMKVLLSRATIKAGQTKIHSSGAGYRGSITVFTPEGIDYETMFGLPSIGRDLNEVSDIEFSNHRLKVANIVGEKMFSESVCRSISSSGRWPTLVIPCICAGAFAAFEVFKIATGNIDNIIKAPCVFKFDALKNIYTVKKFQEGEKIN